MWHAIKEKMITERLGTFFKRKGDRESKEKLVARLALLYVKLPNTRNGRLGEAWVSVDFRSLGFLGEIDKAFLEMDSDFFSPELSVYVNANESWLAVENGSARVRFCEKEGNLITYYEKLVKGEHWLPLGQVRQQDSWFKLEKLVNLGERLIY